MKKFLRLALVALAIVLATMLLFGCSKAYSLSFADESYSTLPETTISPKIKINPRGADYTLTSSNPTIAQVNGKEILALKEGVVTITVQSGEHKDTARLVIISDEEYVGKVPVVTPDYKRINFVVEDYVFSSPMEIQQGMVPGFPNPIIRGGYELDGWYINNTYTTKYDFSVPLLDDTTVYGFWVMKEALFTFEEIQGQTYVKGLFYPKVPYTELVLPAQSSYGTEVVGIKASTFKDNIILEKVTIPSSYKYIEQQAFSGCTKLEQVSFEENPSLVRIGLSAFNGCVKLSTILLPESLTQLKAFAFNNCSSLDIQNIPSGITILEQYVFSNTATVTIDLENITEIKEGAFDKCSKLEGVFNTHNITKCFKFAFRSTLIYATSVAETKIAYIDTLVVGAKDFTTTFTLPEHITLIANEAFSSSRLSDMIITVPAIPPEYVGANVFHPTITIVFHPTYYNTSRNQESSWYGYRSQVCTQFEENGFTLLRYESNNIYSYAIRKYTGEAIHLNLNDALPYPIKTIRSGAFNTNENPLFLKTLTLGNVNTIADYAIGNIPTLIAIIMDTTTIPTLAGSMSISKNTLSNGSVKIYVPAIQYTNYRSSWIVLRSVIYSNSIVKDRLAIAAFQGSNDNYVVQYFGDENTIIIPDDITIYDSQNQVLDIVSLNIISEDAFRYNYSVEHLVIGRNITEIRQAALAYMNLKTLEFLGDVPPSVDMYFLYKNLDSMNVDPLETIYVPQGSSDAYKAVISQKYHSIIVER